MGKFTSELIGTTVPDNRTDVERAAEEALELRSMIERAENRLRDIAIIINEAQKPQKVVREDGTYIVRATTRKTYRTDVDKLRVIDKGLYRFVVEEKVSSAKMREAIEDGEAGNWQRHTVLSVSKPYIQVIKDETISKEEIS